MNRVEAFSDGVIAIIITIMVLELKTPEDHNLESLLKLAPIFLSYALSFLVVAIFWVNHHTLLKMVKKADGKTVWSNNLLLFWLSLVPFVTAYLGKNHDEPLAVALYGAVLMFSAIAYSWLNYVALQQNSGNHQLSHHYHKKKHFKNSLGILLYFSSIPLAYVSIYISFAIFVLIPLMYFLPERKSLEAGEINVED